MTAIVVLEAQQNLDEMLLIGERDVDTLKSSRSRLPIGTAFLRKDLLRLALMASDNRAAAALGRHYPGGTAAMVEAMNSKAKLLGLKHTRFVDPTGLGPDNVASPQDLAILVAEASRFPEIRQYSTTPGLEVNLPRSARPIDFNNTNTLVRSQAWNISLSKTGYIKEAGKCLVMYATIAHNPVVIVLLDSWGQLTRIGDANRIKKWLEKNQIAAFSSSSKAGL